MGDGATGVLLLISSSGVKCLSKSGDLRKPFCRQLFGLVLPSSHTDPQRYGQCKSVIYILSILE